MTQPTVDPGRRTAADMLRRVVRIPQQDALPGTEDDRALPERWVGFEGEDLRGADISGQKLRGAQFLNCDAEGAVFDGVDMRGAVLRNGSFMEARFADAVLEGADMRADPDEDRYKNDLDDRWRGAQFVRCRMKGADLSGEPLNHTWFGGSILRNARFVRASGMDTWMEDCVANGADFSDGSFNSFVVKGSGFDSAVFRSCDVYNPTWDQGLFWDADFISASIDDGRLTDCDFKGADFTKAQIQSPLARDCFFDDTTMRDTEWDYADMSTCSFVRADFMGAEFGKSTFDEADMTGAKLYGVTSKGSAFRGATLEEAVLSGTYTHTDFSGAQMRGADMSGDFSHCDFSEADLLGADMGCATFTECSFNGARMWPGQVDDPDDPMWDGVSFVGDREPSLPDVDDVAPSGLVTVREHMMTAPSGKRVVRHAHTRVQAGR